jgi:(2R)-ethylmalonyl-CoA mutase
MLALYVAAAERSGVDPKLLQGTTQNDIVKEYLSRGTYIFPPGPSMRLISDMVAYSVSAIPKWNPINVCSYHLQEAGATPAQEVAYAMANAIAVLDAVRAREDVPDSSIPQVVGRISFFLNAGIRFVEEICKGRAMTELWDEITRDRYGVEDPKLRRFRYGVQVNSLGLTEAQPENNVIRIVLEALGVTFSKNARCRALQLPAWNEALGLPRPWDQQWSLRIQQILAYETDLLEYDDLFDGSRAVEAQTAELKRAAREELDRVIEMGGAIAAVENAYMKQQLVASHTRRTRAIESGDLTVVGVNAYTEAEESPLTTGGAQSILVVDESAERAQVESLEAFRRRRNDAEVAAALRGLSDALANGDNVVPPSIRAAHAGVTTGEWADALRAVFGEYRAPTGVGVRLAVGKPGLDGHSNGAEQIAVKARDVGMEVVYEGIRLTPEEIVQSARDEGVHVIGLSILSGSHGVLVVDVMERLREAGAGDVPVVVGGIIPEVDAQKLRAAGVQRVYTPKDFDLTRIMGEIVDVVAESCAAA